MVDGGVGFDVGAVDGDVPELEEFEFLGEFEHTDKGVVEGGEICRWCRDLGGYCQ